MYISGVVLGPVPFKSDQRIEFTHIVVVGHLNIGYGTGRNRLWYRENESFRFMYILVLKQGHGGVLPNPHCLNRK